VLECYRDLFILVDTADEDERGRWGDFEFRHGRGLYYAALIPRIRRVGVSDSVSIAEMRLATATK